MSINSVESNQNKKTTRIFDAYKPKKIAKCVFFGTKFGDAAKDYENKYKPLSQMSQDEKLSEYKKLVKKGGESLSQEFVDFAKQNSAEWMDSRLTSLRNYYDPTNDKQDGRIGSFKQGQTGDCWLITALKVIGSTKEGAKTIKESIKDNKDGTYSVSFKGEPGKVYSVSEDDLKQEKFSTGDLDVKILEIAAEKWRTEAKNKDLRGGSYRESKQLITGKSIEITSIYNYLELDRDKGTYYYNKASEAFKKIPEKALFQVTFSQGNPESETVKLNGIDFSTSHSYYAKRENENIVLYNPHNTSEEGKKITIDEFFKHENYKMQF